MTGNYNSVYMGGNEYSAPVLFVICAFMASYVVIYFSRFLEKTNIRLFSLTGKAFEYLGKYSLDIVIWHFIFFRIVIVFEIILNNEALTVDNILSYYPTYSYDGLISLVTIELVHLL